MSCHAITPLFTPLPQLTLGFCFRCQDTPLAATYIACITSHYTPRRHTHIHINIGKKILATPHAIRYATPLDYTDTCHAAYADAIIMPNSYAHAAAAIDIYYVRALLRELLDTHAASIRHRH